MYLETDRIKALCFDVDGTLSDTDDEWIGRMVRWLSPLRFAFPQKTIKPFARWAIMAAESPGNLLYHFLDWADLDDDLARLYDYFSRHRIGRKVNRFWLIEGVAEALEALQDRYLLTVVSARDEASTFGFLDQFDLRKYFKTVATSQTCRHTKPYPDPILWTARELGVAPSECLMIGDTTVDVLAGLAAGAQTVGVLCGFGQEKELRKAGANMILPVTSQISRVLLGEPDTQI